jgi:hypothetical protein
VNGGGGCRWLWARGVECQNPEFGRLGDLSLVPCLHVNETSVWMREPSLRGHLLTFQNVSPSVVIKNTNITQQSSRAMKPQF